MSRYMPRIGGSRNSGGNGRRVPEDGVSPAGEAGLAHTHEHDHGHVGHSHGLGGERDGVWVRVALLLALSVHSVMEGLGVGANSTKAYNLLFAIGVHKVSGGCGAHVGGGGEVL